MTQQYSHGLPRCIMYSLGTLYHIIALALATDPHYYGGTLTSEEYKVQKQSVITKTQSVLSYLGTFFSLKIGFFN